MAYPEVETLMVIAGTLKVSLDDLLLDGAAPSPAPPRAASGSILIRSQDGTALVKCTQVKTSPIALPRPGEPRYSLFAVTGTGFWGEQTSHLGWYADDDSLKKEVAAIAAAMGRGDTTYELKYAAKVKVKLFGVKLER